MHVRPVGSDAVLAEVQDTSEALALAAWAREQRLARDVVPGASTVLLDGLATSAAELGHRLQHRPGHRLGQRSGPAETRHASTAEQVDLPVIWDGPDLDVVARTWGCAADEVGARLAGLDLIAAFCGFAPGFAYLDGLPAGLGVRRRETPRTRVPAGSVALAGQWCGIYPSASPGGWQLVGRTDAALWDPSRPQPALLAPGTRVRFVPA